MSRWAVAFTLVLAGLMVNSQARAERVVLQGSTTFATTIIASQKARVEAATGHTLDVIPNKSSLGLLSLFERHADLAMLSTELLGEVDLLREADPKHDYSALRAHEIGRVRVAFAVHPSNSVKILRLEQLRAVVLGEITSWRDLGGPDLAIRVVAVRDGGGVLLTVERRLLQGGHIKAPDAIRVQVGTQVVRVVAQEAGALGITQLSVIRGSGATELSTDEPIEQTLSLVSLGEPSPAAQAVIAALRQAGSSK